MSDSSKSGSHQAYRQHGDRHDLAESFEAFWELYSELAEQRQDCLGALVVANRDGVLSEGVARDLAEAVDLSDLGKRVRAAMEVLEDELRDSRAGGAQ